MRRISIKWEGNIYVAERRVYPIEIGERERERDWGEKGKKILETMEQYEKETRIKTQVGSSESCHLLHSKS